MFDDDSCSEKCMRVIRAEAASSWWCCCESCDGGCCVKNVWHFSYVENWIHLIPPESVGTWRCDMWKECYDGYKIIHMQKSYSIQPAKMRPMMTRSSDWWRFCLLFFFSNSAAYRRPSQLRQYLPFRAHFTTFFFLSSSIRFVSSGWAVPKPSVYVDVQSVESTIFIINFGHARNRNEIERFFFLLFLPHTTRS